MKLNSKTCTIWTSGLIASALMVSILYSARSEAASPKVDVCHREGNGSFHLITVAYQAVQAHRNHGDALPGEAVPGQSGFTFSDTCTLLATSICPCNFSLSGLAAIGIDGDSQAARCINDNSGINITIGQTQAGGAPRTFATADVLAELGCGVISTDPNVPGEHLTATQAQAEACVNDLRAAANALDVTTSCF